MSHHASRFFKAATTARFCATRLERADDITRAILGGVLELGAFQGVAQADIHGEVRIRAERFGAKVSAETVSENHSQLM